MRVPNRWTEYYGERFPKCKFDVRSINIFFKSSGPSEMDERGRRYDVVPLSALLIRVDFIFE